MEELKAHSQRPAWLSVVMIILTALVGFIIVGPMIGILIAVPFIEGSVYHFVEQLPNPIGHPEMKTPFFIIQGSATFFGLIIMPALYGKYIERIELRSLFKTHRITLALLLITFGIVVFFMGFNSVVIEWNVKLKFPEALSWFETWAHQREDVATAITNYLTQFDSTMQFTVALIVIALFASIGEELVFRGMLQPALHRATQNIHVAIWVSAILFSALHMQFFGFVPRVLLGALFGYLYYWSGNLAVPMFAHFVNNGVSVVALYAVQQGITDIDVESTEAAPLPLVITFSIFVVVLLYFFKKQFAITK